MTQSPNSQSALPKLSIHFVRFGHYHLARLRSAAQQMGCNGWLVQGMQVCTSDAVYAWDQIDPDYDRKEINRPTDAWVTTVFPDAHYEDLSRDVMCRGIGEHLDREQPDAIAIAGWGSADARACLQWARRNRRRTILMSETRRSDGHRVWWKELLKSRLVRKCDAAIVGAKSHADYLVELGLSSNQIFRGYNVIDDQYFAVAANRIQAESDRSESVPFFLASNRFVEVKNLAPAIEAFSRFQNRAADCSRRMANLCMLGDGPLRSELVDLAKRLGLRVMTCRPWDEIGQMSLSEPTVYFPGFRQIGELPEFYARASAFFHPAVREPWGLVINEAMASGLPILASRNGGAAEELVDHGSNGWLFSPANIDDMADALFTAAQLPADELNRMGNRSKQILEERAPTKAFGKGMADAVAFAMA